MSGIAISPQMLVAAVHHEPFMDHGKIMTITLACLELRASRMRCEHAARTAIRIAKETQRSIAIAQKAIEDGSA